MADAATAISENIVPIILAVLAAIVIIIVVITMEEGQRNSKQCSFG